MIADLGGLGSIATRAPWSEVEQVIEARFEWERLPLEPLEGGAVHVGALDAMAGLPFRVVAIPGLVEGGYPGVFRPDPFLLDSERMALRVQDLACEGGSPPAPDGSFVARASPPVRLPVSRKPSQLDLFSESASPAAILPAPLARGGVLLLGWLPLARLRRTPHHARTASSRRAGSSTAPSRRRVSA